MAGKRRNKPRLRVAKRTIRTLTEEQIGAVVGGAIKSPKEGDETYRITGVFSPAQPPPPPPPNSARNHNQHLAHHHVRPRGSR